MAGMGQESGKKPQAAQRCRCRLRCRYCKLRNVYNYCIILYARFWISPKTVIPARNYFSQIVDKFPVFQRTGSSGQQGAGLQEKVRLCPHSQRLTQANVRTIRGQSRGGQILSGGKVFSSNFTCFMKLDRQDTIIRVNVYEQLFSKPLKSPGIAVGQVSLWTDSAVCTRVKITVASQVHQKGFPVRRLTAGLLALFAEAARWNP